MRFPAYMYVFPGQGSQYRGMGEDLTAEFAAARRIYMQASEVLGYDMAELSFRDPQSELGLTRFTQPALLTHSVACMEVFRDLTDGRAEPAITAGHSLGEYSAMVAAGVLPFAEALRLVSKRGELMSRHGKGQMLAVPMELNEIQRYAERHYCGIGGCNLPNQTVVGGMEEDLDRLVSELRQNHARVRPTRLKTEGAFHTYLMIDAAVQFRRDLDETDFQPGRCRVLSNFTGNFHDDDPQSYRYRLFFQLFSPVRWAWEMQRALEEGPAIIIEFGGGIGGESPSSVRPNLAGILKRIIKARRGRFGRRSSDTRTIDYEPLYAPGINVASLREAAHLSSALLRLGSQQDVGASPAPLGSRSHRLFVPVAANGVPLQAAAPVIKLIEKLELGPYVQLMSEDADANASFVASIEPAQTGPTPYLEQVVNGGSEAALHFVGVEAIERLLLSLREEVSVEDGA